MFFQYLTDVLTKARWSTILHKLEQRKDQKYWRKTTSIDTFLAVLLQDLDLQLDFEVSSTLVDDTPKFSKINIKFKRVEGLPTYKFQVLVEIIEDKYNKDNNLVSVTHCAGFRTKSGD